MDGSVTKELIRVANEWDRATVENDAEAIGQYMADDSVGRALKRRPAP